MASISGTWDGSSFVVSGSPYTPIGTSIMNGAVYICNSPDDAYALINAILSITSPKQGEILDVYMIPKTLFPNISPTTTSITNLAEGDPYEPFISSEVIFSNKPSALDGYVPFNKKLLTYPYCYILATNRIGNTCTWRLEDFSNSSIGVTYYGVPTIGGSIISIPNAYKGVLANWNESLIGAKYPTLGWREDSYTNWLTQNSVNNTVRAVSSGGSIIAGTALIAAGFATGGATTMIGVGLLASGTMSGIEAAGEYYQHSIEPDSIKGLVSSGDLLSCTNNMGFEYYFMTIKSEYVHKLDDYFNRYGYRQNQVQVPLFGTSSYRKYWNYVQIANDECVGVPRYNPSTQITINSKDMEFINNIFRAGVTIWKDNAYVGFLTLANIIETPSNS